MLSFDLRSLETHAVRIDAVLPADDAVWQASDTLPTDGVRVVGRLSAAGTGRFYFTGRLEGTVSGSCRRCLTDVLAPVAVDVQLHFVDAAEETAEDDPDVYVISVREHELDLRPAIREEWLLAVPAFVVCRDDCKGLCPRCGADLNLGACGCAPSIDPRWNALQSLDDAAR
jgi:uncharacterized protein